MGFFIGDLHRQIEDLHQQQFTGVNAKNIFTVYRGQSISKDDFEHLNRTKGGLMAFYSFLSTSTDKDVSMSFAQRTVFNPDSVGVLFVMTIDLKQSTAPFASVAQVGALKDQEKEILFAMNTVFRIKNIKQLIGNARLFQVDLELTSDKDPDLQVLTKRIREESYPHEEGWSRLSLVLEKLGRPKQAEELYRSLLQQETDESKNAVLYCRLGNCKKVQGEYAEAIRMYEKSIEIYRKHSPNDPRLAGTYSNIGLVYSNMGEYAKALSSHEKALAIGQQSLPPNHPDLASIYNNIGLVYLNMDEYAKSLTYYEKALAISQQSLPSNHPSLASAYNNIGSVYFNIGKYAKALPYYENALVIKQQALPPDHPDLASTYNNIGSVYDDMGEYAKALSSYEKALVIKEQSLPPNHPGLAISYSNLGLVREKMGNNSKARSFFEKAVDIGQKSLPANHPKLKKMKNDLDRIKNKL